MIRAHVHAVCALTTGSALDASTAEPLGVLHVGAPGGHLDARLRRGASTMTRLLVEASVRVTPEALRARVRLVHGAAWGEVETALLLMDQIFGAEGAPSPARFKASVHNNATGLLSIADANHEGHSAITAAEGTFGACLAEALGMLHDEPTRPVVVAVADEPVPLEFGASALVPPLAIGLLLSMDVEGRMASVAFPQSGPTSIPPALLVSPLSAALPFVSALRARRPGVLELGGGWSIEVS